MHVVYLFLLIPWIAFAWVADYNTSYYDFSSEKKQPVGVAIVAFNRPWYLKELLDSLEKNPESLELPFFFFSKAVLMPNKKKIAGSSMILKSRTK